MSIYTGDGSRNGLTPFGNFTSLAVDLQIIVNKIIKNDTICKLLYYDGPNALLQPVLTPEQKSDLMGKNIRVVPVLEKDDEIANLILIQFDNFIPNETDSATYIEFMISFDILCYSKNWVLDDYMLRPYKIMSELNTMFNMSKLRSSGPINFIGARSLLINENLTGYSLMYKVYDYR
jgi:hypothetical protein